jgi:aspartate carbamoyltransferase catalytic subunit
MNILHKLLDSYSIREKLGEWEVRKSSYSGRCIALESSIINIYALQMQGAEVKVCGPKTLIPKYIESLGVTVEPNLRARMV